MNIGPTKDGKIIPVFEERLRQFGSWLRVNGEGIYNTVPWTHQTDNATKYLWYIYIVLKSYSLVFFLSSSGL